MNNNGRPFRVIGNVKFFGSLQSARTHLDAFRTPSERVWAQDTRRQNGKGEYTGKTFLIGSVKSIYEYVAQRPDQCCVYEVISTKEVCRLYLDIEMQPAEGMQFTEHSCSDLLRDSAIFGRTWDCSDSYRPQLMLFTGAYISPLLRWHVARTPHFISANGLTGTGSPDLKQNINTPMRPWQKKCAERI